jgi:hypothetical protein
MPNMFIFILLIINGIYIIIKSFQLSTRRQLPSRSLSLPCSVPPLCLLGTFEESLLNGRIEPCGYVEGFTAQLGASGSFCPSHLVAVPVSAAFFNLSDDGGPSPYLGHINLSDVTSNGRYRIPLAGTIQLTLFNPNQTVVKMYIVHYDHSDMPPNTSTFIRQKTITDPVRLVVCHLADISTVIIIIVIYRKGYLHHCTILFTYGFYVHPPISSISTLILNSYLLVDYQMMSMLMNRQFLHRSSLLMKDLPIPNIAL